LHGHDVVLDRDKRSSVVAGFAADRSEDGLFGEIPVHGRDVLGLNALDHDDHRPGDLLGRRVVRVVAHVVAVITLDAEGLREVRHLADLARVVRVPADLYVVEAPGNVDPRYGCGLRREIERAFWLTGP